MQTLRSFILSTYFLALPVTLLIILFLPDLFDKYEADLVEKERLFQQSNKRFRFHSDLDGDGISESVDAWMTEAFRAIEIQDHQGGVMNHINLHPQQKFAGDPSLHFMDRNDEGTKEIRCVTHRADSIFLVRIDPFSDDTLRHYRFVDTVMFPVKGKYKPQLTRITNEDLNGDGQDETIFSITTAFSVQPRNIYAYYPKADTIRRSPKSGVHLRRFHLFDLDRDGTKEALLDRTAAYANAPMEMEMPYRDTSAYLMAFDEKLRFLFEPVEFPNFKSFVKATPYRAEEEAFIAVLYQYKGNKEKEHELVLFDENGQRVEERGLGTEEKVNSRQIFSSRDGRSLFFRDHEGLIHELGADLEPIRQVRIGEAEPFFLDKKDIDRDGEDEFLFRTKDREGVYITRSDLSHPIKLDVPAENPKLNKPDRFSVKTDSSGTSQLFIQNQDMGYLFDYRSNPLYYFKYAVYGGIYGFFFLFIYGVQKAATYKLERDKRKLEKTVEERTFELQLKNAELEEKNKAINDSIDYAERIQSALLQSDDHVSEHLPQHFVLFKPQSQVSGDFYWAKEQDGFLYVAAVDCTGHGVPGAFMSMLGVSFLNEILSSEHSPSPGTVLDRLRERVVRELSGQNPDDPVKDGMDAAIVKIANPNSNSNSNSNSKEGEEEFEVEFAGAHNPLYVTRKGIAEDMPNVKMERDGEDVPTSGVNPFRNSSDGIEIKGDRQPVGYDEHASGGFTTVHLELRKGDQLYIFSDGYADQFGGDKGKKFRYGPFKELLVRLHDKPLDEQKRALDRTFEEWKDASDQEQIDDVVVIGIRV